MVNLSKICVCTWLRDDCRRELKKSRCVGGKSREDIVCERGDRQCGACVLWGGCSAGALVVGAGCIDPRGALAPRRRARAASVSLASCLCATRAVRSRPPAKRLPTNPSRVPSVATFDIQRATTLVQPQIAYLAGITLV